MTLWHIKSIIYHGYITCSASASQTLTDTEQVSRSLPTWRDGIRRCEQQAGCISTSRFQKGSWHSTWCDMCSWAELLALQMSWPRVGVWATTQNGKYSIRNERTGQEESVRMAPLHFSFQGNEHRISYFEFQSKPLQVWVIWQSLLKAVPEGNQRFWLQIHRPSSCCRTPAQLWRVILVYFLSLPFSRFLYNPPTLNRTP